MLCIALDEIIDTLDRGALPQGVLLQVATTALIRYRTAITKRRGRKSATNFTRDQHIRQLASKLQEKFKINLTRNRDQKRRTPSICSIIATVVGKRERTIEQICEGCVRKK
jgi:hypothetical protein